MVDHWLIIICLDLDQLSWIYLWRANIRLLEKEGMYNFFHTSTFMKFGFNTHADGEVSDEPAQICSLIRAFIGHKIHKDID